MSEEQPTTTTADNAEKATEDVDVFSDLEPTQRATEIQSLCMACYKTGLTRLLLTRIPHFKEVVLMAFECPHCNYRNSEIQSAGSISEKGCTYTCNVVNSKDLDRQIVRSEFATVRIPHLDFEIPPSQEHGSLTTIEGFIVKCKEDLAAGQPQRKIDAPEQFAQIEAFLAKLDSALALQTPFDLVIEDPSGNSYIENLHLPKVDPQLHLKLFTRTAEQNAALGLPAEEEPPVRIEEEGAPATEADVYIFPTICSQCHRPTDCKMHPIKIPYFKEVIIMAISCDHCGYRTSEVKAGGAIEPKGRRIELKLVDVEDLSRDVLKSESARIIIPEIDLELTSGTLGGRFTTIEGLMDQVYNEIKANPFLRGDSAADKATADAFLAKLKQFASGELLGTFVLDDPLGSSYVQNIYAPDPDPNMTITEYERSWEDNEAFGLNDIQTENYGPANDETEHAGDNNDVNDHEDTVSKS